MVSAFAQQDQQKQPMPGAAKMGMAPGMMHGGMMERMGGQQGGPMAFLKLTDEQKTKIQDLHLAHQKDMVQAQAEIQKQHAAMKLELTADKFNEGKVKSIQAEISKLTGDLALKTALHQRAVRDLLTVEQKKQFDQHILSGGMGGPMGPGGMMGRGGMMGQGGMMKHQGMGGGMMGRKGMNGPAPDGGCNCMK
jgi:Spy/CpxP family protein refolding chaperone